MERPLAVRITAVCRNEQETDRAWQFMGKPVQGQVHARDLGLLEAAHPDLRMASLEGQHIDCLRVREGQRTVFFFDSPET